MGWMDGNTVALLVGSVELDILTRCVVLLDWREVDS
jgi:hypothetical protein